MIAKGGSYRLRGDRGTVRLIVLAQLGPDTLRTGQHHPALYQYDFDDLTLDANGMFDVLISPEKPEGHQGDWWALHPDAEKFMVRIRSEEHTSELQSLMRISYAVFCLTKKRHKK